MTTVEMQRSARWWHAYLLINSLESDAYASGGLGQDLGGGGGTDMVLPLA